VTVVPQEPLGYLTVWGTGQPQPLTSTLNSLDGTILANAAIAPAGTDGAVSFFGTNDTDLVVDINGYFAPPATGGLNFYASTHVALWTPAIRMGVMAAQLSQVSRQGVFH